MNVLYLKKNKTKIVITLSLVKNIHYIDIIPQQTAYLFGVCVFKNMKNEFYPISVSKCSEAIIILSVCDILFEE